MSQHAFERELRLGIRLDPVLGPVVEFGGAGLASTLYNDLSVALAPLSQDEAGISSTRPSLRSNFGCLPRTAAN